MSSKKKREKVENFSILLKETSVKDPSLIPNTLAVVQCVSDQFEFVEKNLNIAFENDYNGIILEGISMGESHQEKMNILDLVIVKKNYHYFIFYLYFLFYFFFILFLFLFIFIFIFIF